MQHKDTAPKREPAVAQQPLRERVGLAISEVDARATVSAIVAAEAAGVRQVWMTQTPAAADTLTVFAAAAVQTIRIRLGTSIIPTYPRHPLAMAQQALALGELAPERLRLGIGSSHQPVIEGIYGIPMTSPMEHLREYTSVLRTVLWEGQIDQHGQFYTVKVTLPRVSRTPILLAALGEGAFQLAGEISDGAISWVCPVSYLLDKARPALQAGAAKAGRPAPPLIAHVPVAFSEDRQAVLAAAHRQLGRYGKLPFYVSMFAGAGFPVSSAGVMSDALINNLVVSGNAATIRTRITELLAAGLDELLIMPIAVADGKAEQKQIAGLLGQL